MDENGEREAIHEPIDENDEATENGDWVWNFVRSVSGNKSYNAVLFFESITGQTPWAQASVSKWRQSGEIAPFLIFF